VPLTDRLRRISRDVVNLSFGFAVLLVWAGFVESFLSQYHEPIAPMTQKLLSASSSGFCSACISRGRDGESERASDQDSGGNCLLADPRRTTNTVSGLVC